MVEICYVDKNKQVLLSLECPGNITVEEAILGSGILQQFTEIDLNNNPVGIFSKKCRLDDFVKEGDRIEIYRPLEINPKEARRLRAKRS